MKTLEELVSSGKVKIIEEARYEDEIYIKTINDSILYSSKNKYTELKEQIENGPDEKKLVNYKMTTLFSIKNFVTPKTYFTKEFDSRDSIFINKNGDLLINDSIFSFPNYNYRTKKAEIDKQKFIEIRDYLSFHKEELPKFDRSIIYKWSNGRLPNPHFLYYYKVGDLKFKSTEECYYIRSDKKYFYSIGSAVYKVIEK